MAQSTSQTEQPASTWAPFRNRLFRVMWLAALVSNVGTFMQMVGAQWDVAALRHDQVTM